MSNQKEALNKWVLRPLLKESDEEQVLMTEGRLFHKVGPAWAKARVPQVVTIFFEKHSCMVHDTGATGVAGGGGNFLPYDFFFIHLFLIFACQLSGRSWPW